LFGVDHPAFSAARRAVELLLKMGRESYRADIIEQEGRRLSVSPLAGQQIITQLGDGMCVGPSARTALYHVTMTLICLGREVQAYCSVSGDNHGCRLVQACVYVDGQYVIRRNVSVMRNGSLEPWGTPTEYTPPHP
jgi:hypothetical protein